MYNLYWLDLTEAARILEKLDYDVPDAIKEFLVKYFIIAYSRPFSQNYDSSKKKNRLSCKHIEGELKQLHKTIVEDVRNKLIAHTDYLSKDPIMSQEKGHNVKFSFTIQDFDYRILLNEKDKLKKLLNLNFHYLHKKLNELNSN